MHQPAPIGDTEAFRRLQEIVRTLRGEHGCPWDIRQTPASLKKYLLEECRELAEAMTAAGTRTSARRSATFFSSSPCSPPCSQNRSVSPLRMPWSELRPR